jgi:23S rRNA pseudouridine2605 synthase
MTNEKHVCFHVQRQGLPAKMKRPGAEMAENKQRLQKLLAVAGYGSRRQCEKLIMAGRVQVDRQFVTELGVRVDADKQRVVVDGVPVKPPRLQYFLVNKPPGVVSTAKDPWARLRVIDLVDSNDRLFTVGRLDKATSGLILVTNDGALANQLAHPRYGITKTYQATVIGRPSPEILHRLTRGIHLAEAFARAEHVTVRRAHESKTVLEIVLAEGRNREIRRMLARVGHKVVQLKRIAIGPVRLGELPLGAVRELTRSEVQALRQSVHGNGFSRDDRKEPGRSFRPKKGQGRGGGAKVPRPGRRPRSAEFGAALAGGSVINEGQRSKRPRGRQKNRSPAFDRRKSRNRSH